MRWLVRYLRSSIGVKQAMAVTGLALVLFAIFHMVGHLQIFGGREVYNAYAHFLQELWEVKWPARAALLAFLLIHLAAGIAVAMKNRAARPTQYAIFRPVVTSAAARTMLWTGAFVFAFLAFHIFHFTVRGRSDTFGMYVAAFRDVKIYALYFAGMALLCLHLGHGAASWLQTLGLRHPKYRVDKLGTIVGWSLFVGYMVPPTAVLVGLVG
ncbi:MAG: succinate dehydrogenase cytochrome b subunit [Deltaproteobacteria bacterium]